MDTQSMWEDGQEGAGREAQSSEKAVSRDVGRALGCSDGEAL